MSWKVGSPKRVANSVNPKTIPSRRMVVNDFSEIPHDYSTTPGGTLFSTTPGGTRIIYDRSFLLHLRNSPLAKSPPKNLPIIAGVTVPLVGKENKPIAKTATATNPTIISAERKPAPNDTVSALATAASGESVDEPQFSMDI